MDQALFRSRQTPQKMIKRLQNMDLSVADEIRSLCRLAYKEEAVLLDVIDFPPLTRSLRSYMSDQTEFYGYLKGTKLVGAIEIERKNRSINIDSLVVDPNYFRKGIAMKLVKFIFDKFGPNHYVVETAVRNEPAVQLYKKFGFQKMEQWNSEDDISLLKFERKFKTESLD